MRVRADGRAEGTNLVSNTTDTLGFPPVTFPGAEV